MAYTTGTASNLADLVTAIKTFAVANAGFTDETSPHATLSKGGIYYHFDTTTSAQIHMNLSDTFSGEAFGAVPGDSAAVEFNTFNQTGPFVKHYLYTEGTCVHCVLEIGSGMFNMLSFGKLAKQGSGWVGGEYIDAGYWAWYSGAWQGITSGYSSPPFTAWNAYSGGGVLRCEDVPEGPWLNGGIAWKGTVYNGMTQRLFSRLPNQVTGRTILLPIYCFVKEEIDDLWFPAGYVPGVRLVNVDYIEPADLVNTDWQVFPLTSKSNAATSVVAWSQSYGFAYHRA